MYVVDVDFAKLINTFFEPETEKKCWRWYEKMNFPSPHAPTTTYCCTMHILGHCHTVRQTHTKSSRHVHRLGLGLGTVSTLGEGCVSFVWALCELCLSFVWALCENSVRGEWVLCECCVSVVWVLCGCSVSVVLLLWVVCERCVSGVWVVCEYWLSVEWVLCESCVNFVWVLCKFCVRVV